MAALVSEQFAVERYWTTNSAVTRMPMYAATLDEAREYLASIQDVDQKVRLRAEAEERAGFPDGNEAYHMWNVREFYGGGPLKTAQYRIVKRTVSDWETVEPKET